MVQERRQRREFADKFKQQMVDLVLSGKPQAQVIKEYDLTHSNADLIMVNHMSYHMITSTI